MIIAILGRQPKLGLAELESLYGFEAVQAIGDQAALITGEVFPDRLGGIIKLAKPLVELPYTDWHKLSAYCAKKLPDYIAHLPEGKLKLGLSAYGLPITAQHLFRSGLDFKKVARTAGRSVRIVPSDGTSLNSAAVLHNQMTGDLGMELIFIKNGAKTWLAQTVWVQDIDDYARRDFGRPKRDAFVGMLPPKLAQIMINLGQPMQAESHAGSPNSPRKMLLDPFCGTGVILQEACLMGYTPYGSDISERMIDFTRENLEWLQKTYNLEPLAERLEIADATRATWAQPDTVVCETYLGQPLSGLPKPEKLAEIMRDCDTIISKFLRNIHNQLKQGTRLCIAVPAWRVQSQFRHLSLLDRLEEMGYNRVRFKHAPERGDLIYHREDQIVARELLVLTVK